jgi:hypothetical protein
MIAAMRIRDFLWLGALAACAGGASPLDREAPDGPAVEVRLRDDGFVDLAGRRVTVDEAVYELRLRCRASEGDAARRPWLRIVAPAAAASDLGPTVDRLREAAYDAGVLHIEFALEGA